MAPKIPRKPAPKQAKRAPAPHPQRRKGKEEAPAGSILMRMGLLLCTGLVVVGLLFASINGGSKYVGVTEDEPKGTPAPPVETVDPNLNVQGSDLTPIPPSASPETDVSPETGEDQPATP